MQQIIVTDSIQEAINAEADLPAGKYKIRFYTTEPTSFDQLNLMADNLAHDGIPVTGIHQGQAGDQYYIDVDYARANPDTNQVGFAFLAVIPLITTIIVAGLIGVGIWKIGDITDNIVKILLIAGGVTIAVVAIAGFSPHGYQVAEAGAKYGKR